MGKNIIVIGGGIVGLSCAYYLVKKGYEVRVLDKSGMDSGASYVNAGYLTPSHIIPLASPGMMAKGLKWMLRSNSPFYLKPRWDIDFFKWAWQFHRASTQTRVERSMPLIAEINLLSKDLYSEIKDSGDLGDFQLSKEGLLMLYKSQACMHSEQLVAEKAAELGLEARKVDRPELESLQPGLHKAIPGAIYYECDAHTSPNQIMESLKGYLRKAGVQILNGEEVTGFEVSGKRITGIQTKERLLQAEEVVLASGAWSQQLAKNLGLRIPIQAGKGYRINVPRPTGVKLPAILMEAKVAVTPMQGFTRFAGTMEFSGINHRIRKERVDAIAQAAKAYYPKLEFKKEELEGAACGLRPVSPDGLPYIGRHPAVENLCIATGHAMMGWSLGPITGKLVSEIISGETLSMDVGAFRPDRYHSL